MRRSCSYAPVSSNQMPALKLASPPRLTILDMANFSIRFVYRLRVSRKSDIPRWRKLIDQVPGEFEGLNATATLVEHPTGDLVQLEIWSLLDATEPWRGIAELGKRTKATESRIKALAQRLSYRTENAELARTLESVTPEVEVRVPVRTDDAEAIKNSADADFVVRQATAEQFRHWVDVTERLASLQTQLVGDYLVLNLRSGTLGVDIAEAYLTSQPRRPARPSPSVKPVWAWASAAIALLSVGLSFVELKAIFVGILAALAISVAIAAVVVSPQWGARRRVTFLGLVPALTLCAFGCAYGGIALLSPGLIEVSGAPLRHLREPLLLSLGLLTTSGFLDLEVHGWVRSLAYVEMLLVASLAGGAVVVVARRASERVGEAITELRRDQRG